MDIDLYDFLKLKDKSQQLFIENNPHIYIYGDLIINTIERKTIKLVNPDSINTFYDQLGCTHLANSSLLKILDSVGNYLYNETLTNFFETKIYDYSVFEADDEGWLIKTHGYKTYVDWVYDIPNSLVVATTYNKDGTLKHITKHHLNQVRHLIKKKNLVGND